MRHAGFATSFIITYFLALSAHAACKYFPIPELRAIANYINPQPPNRAEANVAPVRDHDEVAVGPAPGRPRPLVKGLTDFLGKCSDANVFNIPDNGPKRQHVYIYKKTAQHLLDEPWADRQRDHKKNRIDIETWRKTDGTPFTKTDLIAVDVVARTVMSEMSLQSCGDEYMAATARVILNRANNIVESPRMSAKFTDHQTSADPSQRLIDASLAYAQFSLWNNPHMSMRRGELDAANGSAKVRAKLYDGEFGPLHRAMCPREEVDPVSKEKWERSMALAIDAVANPEALKKKTPGLNALYYTSNMPMYEGLPIKKKFTALGKPLSDARCMKFWTDGHAEIEKAAAKSRKKK